MDHRVIQTSSWADAVFRTKVRSPATFKEEMPAPKETLIKAGWCNIPFYLIGVSSCLVVVCTSAEVIANRVAQMRTLNTAEPLSDGYTVQAQLVTMTSLRIRSINALRLHFCHDIFF